jgi:hypothetical protein
MSEIFKNFYPKNTLLTKREEIVYQLLFSKKVFFEVIFKQSSFRCIKKNIINK